MSVVEIKDPQKSFWQEIFVNILPVIEAYTFLWMWFYKDSIGVLIGGNIFVYVDD